MVQIAKETIFTTTIVEPTGVPARIETTIPSAAQVTDNKAENITTALKFLNIRIADSAGKITKAEINNVPTKFIDNTMIMAITIAMSKLYAFALIPVALAKFSSKVTANIL